MFYDKARIYLKAGNGGNGSASLRREKYVPKGGPDGGDGGDGGSIYFQATHDSNTLMDFKFRQHYRAKPGGYGLGQKKHGKNGQDVVLPVPEGTLIYDDETGELLADLVYEGERFLAAKGGRGGRGNVHFKSSVRQTPREYEKGYPGEEKTIRLQLKLMADVGLVGCPNAGKSTLLKALTGAKVRIGNYPFSTTKPLLGVVTMGFGESFVMADIPGLLKGAHEGVGLGDEFLCHIERTELLLIMIDVSVDNPDPLGDYQMLLGELEQYGHGVDKKPRLVVLSKVDCGYNEEDVQTLEKEIGQTCFKISAVTHEGLEELKQYLWNRIHEKQVDI